MTSPTIIQTPGAIDTAVSGFMQAYQVARQLSDRRRELDLQAQRVASQTNLEGAQARDLQTKIDAGLADHAAANQANQIFAGLAASGDLSDPSKVQVAIGQVKDAAVQGHFGTLYDNWNKGVQTTAQIQEEQARTKLAAQQTQDLQRQATVVTAIHNALSRYEGSDLMTNPRTQARAVADVWTIDPDQAMKMTKAFNDARGRTSVQALPDGSVLVQNDNGQWHMEAHAWGGSQTGGGSISGQVNMQQRLVAAQQSVRFLQRANQIYLIDKDGVSEPPAVTITEEGIGLMRRALGAGAGQTTAQAIRTKHQQMAQMFSVGFVDNYNKTVMGTGGVPRNMQYQIQFRRIYFPIGPLKEGVAEEAYQNRLDMIGDLQRFMAALPRGNADPTTVRGSSDLINAENQTNQLVNPSVAGGDPSQDSWNPNK